VGQQSSFRQLKRSLPFWRVDAIYFIASVYGQKVSSHRQMRDSLSVQKTKWISQGGSPKVLTAFVHRVTVCDRAIGNFTEDYFLRTLPALAWMLASISPAIQTCFSDSLGWPKESVLQLSASTTIIGDVVFLFGRSNGFVLHIKTLSKSIHTIEKSLSQWLMLDVSDHALNTGHNLG
jgi:hypothetical protein